MSTPVRVGIIICDRYHTCAGGKCLRALRAREGAFAAYQDQDVELVGYPPCPHIDAFRRFIPEKYGMQVVVGTHPIPQKYFLTHDRCGTWQGEAWKPLLEATLADEPTRLAYD